MGFGFRSRWTTQLGIAEKTVNGTVVGFQVGFINNDTFLQSVRANVIYPTFEEAQKVLEALENNTVEKRSSHNVVERGLIRFPNGSGYKSR